MPLLHQDAARPELRAVLPPLGVCRRPGAGAARREPAARGSGLRRPATWRSASGRSARTGGCSPTRPTSTVTRSTSCASATWLPGTDLPERIERSYYGLAWSADSRSVFYTVTDPIYRPHQVWRHDVGTAPDDDAACTPRTTSGSRSSCGSAAAALSSSSMRKPRDHGDAGTSWRRTPVRPPGSCEPRRPGIEYRADHADGPGGGELYLVTNDGATEFRLVKAPSPRRARTAGARSSASRPDTRLVACDAFSRYLVLTERRGAATQLRILDRQTGAQRLTETARRPARHAGTGR